MADMQEIEKKLWEAADKMRNNMDPAEYKHVVLGLIFLKYISDRFEAQYQMIKNDNGELKTKMNILQKESFSYLKKLDGKI